MPKEYRNPNAQRNAATPDSLVRISSLRLPNVVPCPERSREVGKAPARPDRIRNFVAYATKFRMGGNSAASWSSGQEPRAVKSFVEVGRCFVEVLGRTVVQCENAQSDPIRQIR